MDFQIDKLEKLLNYFQLSLFIYIINFKQNENQIQRHFLNYFYLNISLNTSNLKFNFKIMENFIYYYNLSPDL